MPLTIAIRQGLKMHLCATCNARLNTSVGKNAHCIANNIIHLGILKAAKCFQ